MNPQPAPQRRQRKAKGNANAKNRSQATAGRQATARKPRRGPAGPQGQTPVAAAYATGQKTGGPVINRTSVDSCRVVHRELIASVNGTSAFTVQQSFPLNPGISSTFPWLSNEALGWERYRFNRLAFCYYTRTGSNVPGSVMLAPDYDASDPAPVSEQAASSYHDAEEDAPWKDIKCVATPRDLSGGELSKYVRSGALAANQDIKTFDAGNLHLCTVDGTAVSWGKLWVEYDVTLFTPQTPPGGFPGVGMLVAGGGSLAAATPFGAVPISSGQFSLLQTAGLVLTFQNLVVGQVYDWRGVLTGTVITAFGYATPVGGTITLANSSSINVAGTIAMCSGTFTATAPSGSLTCAVTATTVTKCNLIFATVPLGAGEV